MATLPQAVQKQVDAAEALMAEAARPTTTPEQAPPPETPQEPQAAAPTSEPTPSPAPPQQPEDDWHQKYQVLQGKYNAEVPNLHHQVKDLKHKLDETFERMEQVTRAQEAKQAEQKPAVDPKDVDSFGSDLVEMVQRVASSTLGGMGAKLEGLLGGMQERIARLEQELSGTTKTVAITAQEAFYNNLTKAVPDWEAINADPRFLAWLGEVDPVLGASRQVALDSAHSALDARRVAGIFQAFSATLPKAASQPASKLSKQVSPNTSAAAAPSQTDKPVMTQKEIADFYKDVSLGRYRGREAEQAKLEAAVNLAMQEGRIR